MLPLGWDNASTKSLHQLYSPFRLQLKDLEGITLHRKVVSASPASSDMECHLFCNSSTTAFSAVVFLQQRFNYFVQTKMLTAKTTVTPLNSLFVPRLKLCAALLGVNLVEAVISALNDQRLEKQKLYASTDSTVTLAWLQELPQMWKIFAANRVAKIQNIIPVRNWNYVPTDECPVDCASPKIISHNSHKP